jgi:hypothetical protein
MNKEKDIKAPLVIRTHMPKCCYDFYYSYRDVKNTLMYLETPECRKRMSQEARQDEIKKYTAIFKKIISEN